MVFLLIISLVFCVVFFVFCLSSFYVMYSMLHESMDCRVLRAPSVLLYVYLLTKVHRLQFAVYNGMQSCQNYWIKHLWSVVIIVGGVAMDATYHVVGYFSTSIQNIVYPNVCPVKKNWSYLKLKCYVTEDNVDYNTTKYKSDVKRKYPDTTLTYYSVDYLNIYGQHLILFLDHWNELLWKMYCWSFQIDLTIYMTDSYKIKTRNVYETFILSANMS